MTCLPVSNADKVLGIVLEEQEEAEQNCPAQDRFTVAGFHRTHGKESDRCALQINQEMLSLNLQE